jgi:hypothetical protein
MADKPTRINPACVGAVRWWLHIRLLRLAIAACPNDRVREELRFVISGWASTAKEQIAEPGARSPAKITVAREWCRETET